jgi:hypothetical protein
MHETISVFVTTNGQAWTWLPWENLGYYQPGKVAAGRPTSEISPRADLNMYYELSNAYSNF